MHAHAKQTHSHICSLVAVSSSKAHYKLPPCVSFAVASNNDVNLFKEFISRNSNYFSGILETIQRGSTPPHKHKQTYYGNTACVTVWRRDKNLLEMSFPRS